MFIPEYNWYHSGEALNGCVWWCFYRRVAGTPTARFILQIWLNQYHLLSGMLFITPLVFIHDDVIKWKHFPRYWAFLRGIRRSPVNSPHKGQGRGALVFSLICAWANGWANHRGAGDLWRRCAHYNVTVMIYVCLATYGPQTRLKKLFYVVGLLFGFQNVATMHIFGKTYKTHLFCCLIPWP